VVSAGARLFLSRLFGGLFLRRGVSYVDAVSSILLAKFPSLPGPFVAENGNGSTPLLADGAQTALLFRLIQFVGLCGDYQVLSAVILGATASGPDRLAIQPRRASSIRQQSFRVSLSSK